MAYFNNPRLRGAEPAPPLPGTGPAPQHPSQPAPEQEQNHRDSVAKYPELHLSQGEYVLEVVRRHPIGLISIWFFTGIILLFIFGGLAFYSLNVDTISTYFLLAPGDKLPSGATLFPLALILVGFVVLGGTIATIVYRGNRFYLTNESIIQFVQTSLFSTRQQVVNLINVEDASSDQVGILEQVLNYGTLRLSTQGEETTYRFYFVANPRSVVNNVNEAAEHAVKRLEGMPVQEL